MALLSDYYVDGDSGNDTTGDGTIGNPFATVQKSIDTIKTESSSDLTSPASGVVTIHLVAGQCGTNTILIGLTDDASNYVRILGRVHPTKVQWDVSAPCLNTTAFNAALGTLAGYLRVEQVQIDMTAGGIGIGLVGSNNNSLVDRCILLGADDETSGNVIGVQTAHSSGTVTIRRTVVYGIESNTGINDAFVNVGTGTVIWQNCAAFTADDTAGTVYGFRRVAGTATATNCYSHADTNYSGTITLNTCAASNTEGTSATLDNIALTTANFADPLNGVSTSRDFSLVFGTNLIDNGTDLSGSFTTGFNDNSYGAIFDVGPGAEPVTSSWYYHAQQ